MNQKKANRRLVWLGAGLGLVAGVVIDIVANVAWLFAYSGELAARGPVYDAYWVLVALILGFVSVPGLGLYGAVMGGVGGRRLRDHLSRIETEEGDRSEILNSLARKSWLYGAIVGVPAAICTSLLGILQGASSLEQSGFLGSAILSCQVAAIVVILLSAMAGRIIFAVLTAESRMLARTGGTEQGRSTTLASESSETGVILVPAIWRGAVWGILPGAITLALVQPLSPRPRRS